MTLWESMDSTDRYNTLRNMELHGGGFASKLALAWYVADSGNSEALAAAFPHLIEKFQPKNWEYSDAQSN